MQKSKAHKKVCKRTTALNNGFKHLLRLPWNGQDNYWWNEVCADIMEVFGLPGEKYVSHPTPNYMDFYFKSTKDLEFCKILISDKVQV